MIPFLFSSLCAESREVENSKTIKMMYERRESKVAVESSLIHSVGLTLWREL